MSNMARLTDADKLIQSICRKCNDVNYDDPCEPSECAFYYAVHNAPTVDAVEVVRCKDCEWWMYEYDDVGLCVTDVPDIDGVQRCANDFCSYGERKTDEAD